MNICKMAGMVLPFKNKNNYQRHKVNEAIVTPTTAILQIPSTLHVI